MPRPGRPAPGTPRPAGTGPAAASISPAVAARVRQLAAQAEHRRAIAEFRARHAADQQARVNALLLEAISARTRLTPGATNHQQTQPPARPAVLAKPCRHVNTQSRRIMCKQRGR